MRRSKKFVLMALLAVVVLAGSIGGVVFAQTENEEDSPPPPPRHEAMLQKVCDIYNEANPDAPINCDELKAAFKAALDEMRPEGMPKRGEMPPEGMLNRGEMDPEAMKAAMLERLEALYEEGKITDEQYAKMKERIESAPDDLSGFGFRGHGKFRGFGRPFAPPTTESN